MSRALIVLAVIEGGALARPAALHTAAIPDGEHWWCDADRCEREQAVCGPLGDKCAAQPTAWVATGRDARHKRWARVAAPTAATCAARSKDQLAGLRDVSACVEIGATAPVPPDRSLVPRGAGWFCRPDAPNTMKLPGLEGSKTHCFRTRAECNGDDPHSNVAVLRDIHDAPACVAAKSAWVMTTNDGFQAAATAADCAAERAASADRTACAETK